MGQAIRVRRGDESQLPTLQNGEFGLTQDTQRLFIGTPGGNIEFAKESQLADMATQTDMANGDQTTTNFLKGQYKASDNNLLTQMQNLVDYVNNKLTSAVNAVDTDLAKTNITTSFDGSNQLTGTKVTGTNTWVTLNKTQLNMEYSFTLTGATYFVLCANATKCATVSLGCTTADFGWMTRWFSGSNQQILATFADTSGHGNVGDIVKISRTSTGWHFSIQRSGQTSFIDWFDVAFNQPTTGTNLSTEFTETEKQYGYMKYTATTSEVLAKNIQYKNLYVLPVITKYSGKVWNAIGDSITFQNLWEPTVQSSLGISSYNNYGKSGYSTVMLKGDEASWSLSADIITFFAGTNDFGRCDTLATTQSSVTDILNYLITNFPNKTIVVCLPTQRWGYTGDTYQGPQPTMTNSSGLTLRQYCDTIKSVADGLSIPVCDLYYLSGITKDNITTYTSDGLHPNTAGATKISNVLIDFLNSL